MGSPVVWFEVAGRDLDTLREFYTELFGWKVDTSNPAGYGMVDTGVEAGIPGGIAASGADADEHVTFYVAVPKLDAALANAEKLGGKIALPVTDVPGGPTIALIDDPEGHRIGLIQQA